MKKIYSKFIASMLTAAIVTSTAALTASAVDYVDDPGYTTPTNPAEVVTENVITNVLKEEKPVVYVEDKNVSVKETAIAAIAKSEKLVTFEAKEYSVTVDPAKIKKVKAINLAMEISVSKEETKVDNVTIPDTAVVIAPAQKGDFGMTVSVTIPKASVAKVDKTKAKLYYIADNGNVSEVKNALSFDKDGNAVIEISHASKYVISDKVLAENDSGNTPGGTPNPATGITFGFALAAVAGACLVASRKRK